MAEKQSDYVTDALEMIGAGYDHPSIEIEAPRTVLERRQGRMQEVERAAFVKISTAFKPEMKDIDEIALKVWLYIALSVNRHSGKANPGLRTIAEECGFAVNTVRGAIERLEEKYNLLIVHKGERRYNIYEPVAFISANRNEPVSPDDTDTKTVSFERKTVSPDDKTVSARVILNQINQSNQNMAQAPKNSLPLDWQVATEQKEIVMPQQSQFDADKEIACMNISRYGADLVDLAAAFMDARQLLPKGKSSYKTWAVALREMVQNRVTPEIIRRAVHKLTQAGMTVTDPHAIRKTAIDMANKAPEEKLPIYY